MPKRPANTDVSTDGTDFAELDDEHPRKLIPSLCRQFYDLGWVTGTGGGVSIKQGKEIYIAPSGVQKERIQVSFFVLCNYRYDEELVVPIIENTPFEEDLKEEMFRAMQDYPDTCAVLVRRHGVYVWGDTWQKAKTMCECYDYLFDMAVQMKGLGLDPTETPTPPKGAYVSKTS
ncbi:methylthioribulose-1-phosphate dehydratase [Aplysia californica]|uniref:Methylthioribulose-1-phosphate dehydratase n=1 Tax=Aplysia californica TaxID=6500 RepID=A0ABM1W196_APLCA|nr:methylthioribulose-1-phosphate dehydratase [Aplysia californica]